MNSLDLDCCVRANTFLLPRKGSYIYLRTFARAQHVVCVFPGSPALVDLIRKGPPEMRPSGGEMLLAVQFGVVIVCVCALLAKCACVSACVFVCVHANTGFYYCALFFLRRDLAIYAFFLETTITAIGRDWCSGELGSVEVRVQ